MSEPPGYSQITQLAQTSRIGITFRCFPGLSLRMMAQGVRTQTDLQSAQHLIRSCGLVA